MSRPRFLADQNLIQPIVNGVRNREPLAEFILCRDVGMDTRTDTEVLEFAAKNGLIVVSHDTGTMQAAAYKLIVAGQPMTGLLLAHQDDPIGPIIDELLLIWSASEAEEWHNVVRFLPL